MKEQEITVQVKFFASLRESLGVSEVSLDVPEESTITDLLTAILHLYNKDHASIDINSVHVSINQELAQFDQVVSDGDEIALFPPITGG